MYEARGFRIVMIRGDFEFNGITAQVASLPGSPHLNLETGTHTGPVERNIKYIKEKGSLAGSKSSIPEVANYNNYLVGSTCIFGGE
jgi:hypothetical protein